MENREWVAAVSHPTDYDDQPHTALRAYTLSIQAILEQAAVHLGDREREALFDIVRRTVA